MKKKIVAGTIVGIAALGGAFVAVPDSKPVATSPKQDCELSASTTIDRRFRLDDQVVQKVVPDYETCTVTIFLKNGKSKSFPFSWDKVKDLEDVANRDFIKGKKMR